MFASPIDMVLSGEQVIYERQQMYMKQFISLGFSREKLYRVTSYNSTLTFDVAKIHKENEFGLLKIYDCSLVFKSLNPIKQSLDSHISKSQNSECL